MAGRDFRFIRVRDKSVKETVLIIGGCRSGKSRYALELAKKTQGDSRIFIATCVPKDKEMAERVARHKEEREKSWSTIEIPIHLPEAIIEYSRKSDLILVDCLTLWISNLILDNNDLDISEATLRLTRSLKDAQCPVIMVSNEVGTGIVPENDLARLFRDAAGIVNQNVAACSDRVIWMVAGIPVPVKKGASI
ncbi:MAG: bifunctional adenosylcobinamide kinase/adenosylcobinamide-phosphate guanylyltransferase [Proteobacteria bacterium]|nr:bifunctional adenosylcobinamide kinase/adenosylcobinamide-phosphate guanylyltransferase [Desulfobacteraceae bacterium]MBU3979776.1 bifunctional adenosylcobinamide kinase/adenosylcobinamide-phosphate guanylyltransferase [Pseudomonadota bacterium]MBU4012110.1 bifunctional adenosylcobinamide kinase/adenosylcobinamide-phosphate guanylyltransferase [Pseudomonadota bacterium]MBU4067788.1 bifunctional adenosylcobinamide kinase/adenosylcobinamide-phosphate guanylyltransferase [Pseudomonadota bacteriu